MSTAALTAAPVVQDVAHVPIDPGQRRALRWTMYVGFIALAAGVTHGFAQALSYANIDILTYFPHLQNYYQGLTVHGVANVLIFTFAFSNGFLVLLTARALSRQPVAALTWGSFGALVVGNILTAYAVISGQASVLFTSYSPLQAHWTYYLGLALVVVSTWLALINMLVMYRGWRKGFAEARIPLLAFLCLISYVMWFLASLPIAVLFLGINLPWTLGLIPLTDPLLSRTLFWFTGHAIVYAWLLPAYVSWYALIPRQVGGRILSDSLTRFVFILFLLLSIPTGFHHQYTDPGISETMKFFHGILTFGVFFPSLATAFSVMAALEMGGRARGGTGLFAWIKKLPWDNPSVTAQLLAMIAFIFGGITGLINASVSMNQVIHNTTWVPGHFHLTIGTAVALTIIGVAYWMVPYLTGRQLWSPRAALVSSWMYVIGVLIFSRGMVSAGLEGMPRRLFRAGATYDNPAWDFGGILTGIGGTLMFIALLIFFVVMLVTIFAGKKGGAPTDIPWSETLTAPATSGFETNWDRIGLWVIVAVALILLAYGPFFVSYFPAQWISPGYTFY
jgi:cytochrome c oxidase subunit I